MLERMWRRGTLLHCWWEFNLIQSLWITVWRLLWKLGINLQHDPATLLLGIHITLLLFSHLVVSDSLQLHGLKYFRLPCSYLPEFGQIYVHWLGDAIQPSHPLSSPFPLAFKLSQHQGLFKWVSSLQQVAKGLEFDLQHQSFQWIFRIDSL